MARKKKEPFVQRSTHGGSYVRCPKGHNHARLLEGKDARGKYLDVWCLEPNCGTKERYRPEPRIE